MRLTVDRTIAPWSARNATGGDHWMVFV